MIPRHELLENVWGMPGHVQTRAPDQFIRRLRKAFEPDPANPIHFLTIRDAGYRFVAEPTDAADAVTEKRRETPAPASPRAAAVRSAHHRVSARCSCGRRVRVSSATAKRAPTGDLAVVAHAT